jgi:recombination protein RecA
MPRSREDARTAALDQIRKEVDTIDLSGVSESVECIKTGVVAFDLAMDGGWPVGRLSELAGDWQSGKSLLAYQSIAECQRQGGIAFLDDVERALDKTWARKLGINLDELFYYHSSSLEDGFQHLFRVCTVVRNSSQFRDVPVLYIKDSLEASIAKDEAEKEFGEMGVAMRSRAISSGLRRLMNLIADQRIAVVLINQLRTNIGPMYGPKEETTGGRAPKFYASMRTILRKGKKIKDGERTVGIEGTMEVLKSKIGTPFKSVHFQIIFRRGIGALSGLLPFLVTEGAIKKLTPHSYQFGSDRFRPQDFSRVWTESNEALLAKLKELETESPERNENEDIKEEGE